MYGRTHVCTRISIPLELAYAQGHGNAVPLQVMNTNSERADTWIGPYD